MTARDVGAVASRVLAVVSLWYAVRLIPPVVEGMSTPMLGFEAAIASLVLVHLLVAFVLWFRAERFWAPSTTPEQDDTGGALAFALGFAGLFIFLRFGDELFRALFAIALDVPFSTEYRDTFGAREASWVLSSVFGLALAVVFKPWRVPMASRRGTTGQQGELT